MQFIMAKNLVLFLSIHWPAIAIVILVSAKILEAY